jgi:hypothetical protein
VAKREHSDLPHGPVPKGTLLVRRLITSHFLISLSPFLSSYPQPSLLLSSMESSTHPLEVARFVFVFVLFVSALFGNQNTYVKSYNYLIHLHRDVWSEAFSPKGPVGDGMKALDAWDLRNSFGQKKSKFNKNEEVMISQSLLLSDASQLYSVLSFEAITAVPTSVLFFLRPLSVSFSVSFSQSHKNSSYCDTSHVPYA